MTFKKGRDYAEGRRVALLSRAGDGKLTAKVSGSTGERYDVELSPGEGKVLSRCSCESWDKYGPHCKHVVAVALVYMARTHAESNGTGLAAEVVVLPALAKIESWLGLSSLPDFEFL